MPRFITAVIDGRRPVFHGTGEISRDFVHVDDVVEANLLASAASSPSGLTCNVASGTRTTLRELLSATCAAAGRNVEPIVGPSRPGDIPHSQADISLARDSLGFVARLGLEAGIARTFVWFRDHRLPPRGDE